jgi:hypothetical protein
MDRPGTHHPSDSLVKGFIVQGTHHPRDVSFLGRIVQGTYNPEKTYEDVTYGDAPSRHMVGGDV